MRHYLEIFESDLETWHKAKELTGIGYIRPYYDSIVVQRILEEYIEFKEKEAER